MDIQDLNKTQLILLALLLSFVTSIATGITTVTLMQQAPASVTVPINRIIRQTVEKIVPAEIGKPAVQTIVIKEEDLVVDAIAKNQSAIFSIIKETTDGSGLVTEVSAGRGFVISTDGMIVADAALVPDKEVYYVSNDSGKFKADFVSAKDGFSFLKIGAPLDEKNKVSFAVPTFGDIKNMKIGQKVITLGSSISSFIYDGSKDLKLNVTKSNAGGMILDLDGDVLGIALSGETASFASISTITDALKTATIVTPVSTGAAAAIEAPKVQ